MLIQRYKRTPLLCVFFLLFGCQQPPKTDSVVPIQQETMPLLTLNELLSAEDVQEQLAIAARTKSKEQLAQIQSILIDAAQQVYLSSEDINLLSGSEGLIFLEFQGNRINFNRDFEKAFFNFTDLNEVYERYPAFEQLRARSESLVDNRDRLVQAIESNLIARGETQDTLQKARQEWQRLMQAQGLIEFEI